MSLNKLLAVIYSDLFDFPLTPKEANFWQIEPSLSSGSSSRELPKTIVTKSYVVLAGREGLVGKRVKRQIYSKEKEETAREVTKLLRIIPSICGIFLTGSVAVQNAKKGADIDLMIITNPQALWLTRMAVVLVLKIKGLYREKGSVGDRICTNIYLDTNHLRIRKQNLFTAHEVLQAKCLYDRGGIEELWLGENPWVREYLPVAGTSSLREAKRRSNLSKARYGLPRDAPDGASLAIRTLPSARTLRSSLALRAWTGLFLPFELLSFAGQYLYMKSKMTNERVSWGYAYFHPNDLSEKILTKFKKRLRTLGIM